MTTSKARIAVCATTIFASCSVLGCSTSAPSPSPTAVRLIAGMYHHQIKSASCPDPDFNSRWSDQRDNLGPVHLSQSGSTVTIDSDQRAFGIPVIASFHMSGTISGEMLSFQFSGEWSPRTFVGWSAEGHGVATINAPSISGRFSGSTKYWDPVLNFPQGAYVPCTSDDHSIVLTRVS
jgi:hypothetical protein